MSTWLSCLRDAERGRGPGGLGAAPDREHGVASAGAEWRGGRSPVPSAAVPLGSQPWPEVALCASPAQAPQRWEGAHQDRDRWQGMDKHSGRWSQTPKPPLMNEMQTKGTHTNSTAERTAGTGGETWLAAAASQYPTCARSPHATLSGQGSPTDHEATGRWQRTCRGNGTNVLWSLTPRAGAGPHQGAWGAETGRASGFPPQPPTHGRHPGHCAQHVRKAKVPTPPNPVCARGTRWRKPQTPTAAHRSTHRALTAPHLAKRPP